MVSIKAGLCDTASCTHLVLRQQDHVLLGSKTSLVASNLLLQVHHQLVQPLLEVSFVAKPISVPVIHDVPVGLARLVVQVLAQPEVVLGSLKLSEGTKPCSQSWQGQGNFQDSYTGRRTMLFAYVQQDLPQR